MEREEAERARARLTALGFAGAEVQENLPGELNEDENGYGVGLNIDGTPYLLWDQSAVETFLAVQRAEESGPPS
jgi:hypothetical protein